METAPAGRQSPRRKPSIKRSLTTRITLLLALALGALFAGVYLLVLKPAVSAIAQNQLDQALTRIRYGLAQQLGEVERMLNAGSEWTLRASLGPGDRDTLNTLFMPVIVQSPSITSILYAYDDSSEWMLLKRPNGWSNRMANRRLWRDGVYWFDWSSLVDQAVTHYEARDYDPRRRPWYQTALAAAPDSIAWTAPYRFLTTQEPGMTATKHWLRADGRVSVMAFDVKLKDLSALASQTQFNRRGGVVIATQQGQVLAVSEQRDLLGDNALNDALLQPLAAALKGPAAAGLQRWREQHSPTRQLVHFSAAGLDWVTEFAPYTSEGQTLLIGVFAPLSAFVPGAEYQAWIMLALLALVLLVSLIITLRLARHFSAPLVALVDTSRRIGDLELDAVVDIATPTRELHQLVQAQDLMRQRLLDATDRLEQQVAARTAELSDRLNFQRVLIDVLPNPIFILDQDARFIDVNPAYASAFGIDKAALIGRDAMRLDTLPLATRKRYLESDRRLLEEGGSIFEQLKMRFADGQLHDVLYWARRFDSDGGRAHGLIGLIVDISEQKAAELEAMQARTVAEDAARAKSEFLANMSHEIRTPMNAIVGFGHLAQQTELTPQQRGYIDNIERSSQALLRIVNDILDFSKIEAGKLVIEQTELDLDEVLGTLSAAVAQRAAEKGLELLIDLAPQLPDRLCGDPGRLEQILINLVGNAIKFTAQGEVRVSISALDVTDARATLLFQVSDSGIGMRAEQMQRLFQPFSQADSSTTRRFGGTGLGLSICKQLVSAMGGDIGVESHYGAGCQFHFSLPFARSATPPRPRVVPQKLAALRVLLVDDNAGSREILARYCSELGFRVTQAASGQEALFELNRNRERIDLVLMDWKMPALDGIETSRLIRDRFGRAAPRIIMVTAYGFENLAGDAGAAGLDGFLVKPVNPSTLYNAVVDAFADLIRPPQAQPDAPQKPCANADGAELLVVEDNEINQLLAQELLQQAGFRVTLADNGQQALERLAQQRFALVLMDIQMPVMDGLEATRRIRQQPQWRQLPVIAMTANALASDREACLAAGMNDHISKPIDVADLYRTLERWLPAPCFRPDIDPANSPDNDTGNDIDNGLDCGSGALATPLPPAAGPADLGLALTRLGGRRALLQGLIERFCRSRRDSADELRRLLARDDLAGAARLAHTLKGLAGTLGDAQLSGLAADLEQRLGRGERPEHGALDALERALQALLAQLQPPGEGTAVLSTPAPTPAPTPAADDDAEAGSFAALHQALAEADLKAIERFESFKQRFPQHPLTNRLDAPIQAYDFETALELLERYQSPPHRNPQDELE